jgi:hypothetical protein
MTLFLFYRILSVCQFARPYDLPAGTLPAALFGSTRNDGICPPPLVTFARLVLLNRVKYPATLPRKR